jgi:precorrin-6Y C5,15-methyltransferase (decarboxylating)
MITKWEVRAIALARLRPTLGTLVWDVGTGSGSVAVECAGHHAAVIALDPDPDAGARVADNALAHGVDVRVVTGTAPQAYAGLPDPDAVFVGGGGLPALAGAVERRPARVVAAYAAVDRMVAARAVLHDGGYAVEGVQLSAARLADLPDHGVRLAATNPVFLLSGTRP